jgi:hypothetical protein
MQNVAADPAYFDALRRLRGQLMAELHRTGDPRVKDGGRYYETPPLAGPLAAAAQLRPRASE